MSQYTTYQGNRELPLLNFIDAFCNGDLSQLLKTGNATQDELKSIMEKHLAEYIDDISEKENVFEYNIELQIQKREIELFYLGEFIQLLIIALDYEDKYPAIAATKLLEKIQELWRRIENQFKYDLQLTFAGDQLPAELSQLRIFYNELELELKEWIQMQKNENQSKDYEHPKEESFYAWYAMLVKSGYSINMQSITVKEWVHILKTYKKQVTNGRNI